ncbi:MAG: sugar ABC transporter substrate-binding protein [Actinomycetota bacterium]
MSKRLFRLLAALMALALVAAACGSDDDEGADDASASASETETTEAEAEEEAEADDTEEEAEESTDEAAGGDVRVAYFGYSNVNGFTQGIWTGVQNAAAEAGVEAELFDGQFDGDIQAQQIQNATTSGDYDIYIISANNGAAITPAVEEAIAEGIAVTAVYSAVGPDFLTLDPQIDGMLFAGTPIAENGSGMAEMAIEACGDTDPCYVSYLIGFANFPLDDARTAAFEETIATADNVVLVDNAVGGYDQATGQEAADAVFLANDEINVMVGSSQAILGAEQSAISNGVEGVQFIGNGSPTQAVEAVNEGRWYGVWVDVVQDAGRLGVELGVQQLNGENPPASTNLDDFAPVLKGTADSLGDFEGQWTN